VPRTFGRYGIAVDDFRLMLSKAAPFDLVFITSIMSWWYPGVRKAVEIIREERKDVPIVLGGIYATLWHAHASATSGADFIFKGPFSEDAKIIFNTFGFRLKRRSGEAVPYYRLGLYQDSRFAPVLTGAGCPFACSYCASRILWKRFSQRTPTEVAAEIKDLCERGVRDFAFYDDALFVNAAGHIKPILDAVKKLPLSVRLHCPNGLHARFIDDELARLMRDSGFRTVRLGFETADAERQKETGDKVTCKDLAGAVGLLKKYGFTKKDIGVYLMYGLPGQTLVEVGEGVGFLKNLGVSIHLVEFSPIPGTECWRDLEENGIVREGMDPLLTNNTVFSYLFSGYAPHEVDGLKLAVKSYNMS
jgi:radical SAM superfamily enzyme YgiQ (UPF0313 family)